MATEQSSVSSRDVQPITCFIVSYHANDRECWWQLAIMRGRELKTHIVNSRALALRMADRLADLCNLPSDERAGLYAGAVVFRLSA